MTGEKIAEDRERPGLGLGGRRMLVGGVSRGRAAADELVAIVRLGVVGLDRGVRVGEPVGRIFRRRSDGGGGEFLRRAELAGDRGRGGSLAKVFGRLVPGQRPDRCGLGTQGLGQAHGVARHLLARERLHVPGESSAGRHENGEESD